MHKFIEALRSASPAQAQNMLQDLRTCDGAKDLLSTLTLSQSQPHELRHRDSDSSVSSNNPSPPSMTTDTILTPHTSRSRSANSDGKLNPLLSQLSSNGFENESPSSTEATYQPFSDFERQLPSRGTLQECINSFHKEAGKLFHVFSLNHIESQFSVMYGQGDKQAQRVAACELSAVGALGSQYIRESQPEGTAQKMYSVAKHLLEDVVSVDATRAAKVCAMLGLFNIMSKEKVAMTFVGKYFLRPCRSFYSQHSSRNGVESSITTTNRTNLPSQYGTERMDGASKNMASFDFSRNLAILHSRLCLRITNFERASECEKS